MTILIIKNATLKYLYKKRCYLCHAPDKHLYHFSMLCIDHKLDLADNFLANGFR